MANKITEIGLYYDQIPRAPSIESVSYENFFKLNIVEEQTDNNERLFFNLLKKINIVDKSTELNPQYFDTFVIDVDLPWVILSYNIYSTLNLWWLLCLANNIQDPTKNPELGSYIKVIKPEYVDLVVNTIKNQLAL